MKKSHTLLSLLIWLALLLSLSACSTVYDNTVGLVYGGDSESPSEETASEPNSEVEGSVSNTSERISEKAGTTSKVPVEGTPPKGVATDEVEVLWKIPEEEVEGFVLKYGFSRESLPKELSLSLSEIEKYDDPEFGFVYRYVLKDIPPSQSVFVRLATKSDGKLTPFSEVFEVAAEK